MLKHSAIFSDNCREKNSHLLWEDISEERKQEIVDHIFSVCGMQDPSSSVFLLSAIESKHLTKEEKISIAFEYCASPLNEGSELFLNLFDGKLIDIDTDAKAKIAKIYASNVSAKFNVIYHLVDQVYGDGDYTKSQILFLYAQNPSCDSGAILSVIRERPYFGNGKYFSAGKYVKFGVAHRYAHNKNADMNVFLKIFEDSKLDPSMRIEFAYIALNSKKCTKKIVKLLLEDPIEEIRKIAMNHRFGKPYGAFV
jgi:hypothetical protein